MYEGELFEWFKKKWKELSNKKLDMGKCCIRFKKTEDIPLKLIGELSTKISCKQWIQIYEDSIKKGSASKTGE